MTKVKDILEGKKFLFETAGDARDYLKKQLLELSAREMLSIGFFIITGYLSFRCLGRVLWVPEGKPYDPDDPFFQDINVDQWFWGHMRSVLNNTWEYINNLREWKIPGLDFKPFMFMGNITYQWAPMLVQTEHTLRKDGGDRLYYKSMPMQFRILFVFMLMSTLYVMKEFIERTIEGIGEIIPL
ncbi:MAG: hypothetical protein ACXAEN_20325 [Candidatus Thorarchaeota archaeon]